MTTKNDLLSFSKDKQQQNLFTVNLSSSNGKFNNLNLNQNHESDVADVSSVNSKNVETDTKKDLNYVENVLTKTKDSNPWNKNSQTNSIIVNNDSGKKVELKKNLNDPKNLNRSTLSLHIAAYENCDSSNLETCATKATESGTLKNPKHLFGINSNLVIQNSFEFSRQQQGNGENKKPEVGQFKASQKLVDQKKPVSSSNASSSKQQPAAPQNPNQSGSFLGLGLDEFLSVFFLLLKIRKVTRDWL
uniref:Uncharacterized protein n=1 Tax=Panagrolaimus sp. PS1159 TaxID=55785 RepID=A0AC35G5T9_9BILA